MAMQIGMGFGKFLARVLFQELGVSVPSSVFHVLFITRSLHALCVRVFPVFVFFVCLARTKGM